MGKDREWQAAKNWLLWGGDHGFSDSQGLELPQPRNRMGLRAGQGRLGRVIKCVMQMARGTWALCGLSCC